VTFQVLTAASTKFRSVFWDVLPCKIIIDNCTSSGPDDGGSTYLWNVGRQLFYKAVHPRRQIWTSYSPPWELEISHLLTCFKRQLYHCPDDGGSTYLWNVGRQLFYNAVHPRRQIWTSYSPPWELEISHLLTCLDVSCVSASTSPVLSACWSRKKL
jgi:hypothetical protein